MHGDMRLGLRLCQRLRQPTLIVYQKNVMVNQELIEWLKDPRVRVTARWARFKECYHLLPIGTTTKIKWLGRDINTILKGKSTKEPIALNDIETMFYSSSDIKRNNINMSDLWTLRYTILASGLGFIRIV